MAGKFVGRSALVARKVALWKFRTVYTLARIRRRDSSTSRKALGSCGRESKSEMSIRYAQGHSRRYPRDRLLRPVPCQALLKGMLSATA